MTPDMTHEQWLQDQLNLANEHCDQLRDQLRAERDSLKAELADEKKAHEYTKELLTGTAKQILDLEAALRAQASPDADWVLVPKKITREIAIVLEGAADDWEPGLTTIRMWQFEWDRVLAAAAPTAAARQKEGYFHVGTGGEDEPPPIAL